MRSRHGRRGAGTDFIATDDPYQRAELMAGHLHRLEAALDRTRAAVVSLRQLLRPDAVTLDVELRSVSARTVAASSAQVRVEDSVDWFSLAMDELDAAFPPTERTGPPGGRYANELFTSGAGVMADQWG
ncbi:hypothetical protein [Solwaraspora sp. WMMA2065]|uniref:hypothetical protein n=1 Tax=Solwaraspora sp. WMMA2065 TaxID=3015166 RepID=UPI00259B919E|nr:hypothetical protein [Solwaraspora sp. WMMA2065]WJK36236.1 hypothetical protein O7610_07740 [Solwaraspora sp. WMMA2065]